MKSIDAILKEKSRDIYSVVPDTTVFDALRLMAEKNIGAVLVIENDQVLGILSERDYARKVALEGKTSREMKTREIMSSQVLFIDGTQTPEDAMVLMTEKHVRHLPVFEGSRLVGVLSIGDVVKALIDERNFTIDQLVRYIQGSL